MQPMPRWERRGLAQLPIFVLKCEPLRFIGQMGIFLYFASLPCYDGKIDPFA